jgi:hypothetical protein
MIQLNAAVEAELVDLQRVSFSYFEHEVNPANGLVADKTACGLKSRSAARAVRSLTWVKAPAKRVRAAISTIISGRSTRGRRSATAARTAIVPKYQLDRKSTSRSESFPFSVFADVLSNDGPSSAARVFHNELIKA